MGMWLIFKMNIGRLSGLHHFVGISAKNIFELDFSNLGVVLVVELFFPIFRGVPCSKLNYESRSTGRYPLLEMI